MTNKRYSKSKSGFSNFGFKDYFLLVFFIVAIGIVPIIVKYVGANLSPEESAVFGVSPQAEDLFAYAKSVLFVIFSSIALCCYGCYYVINIDKIDFSKWKKIVKKPYIIAFGVFALTIFLSTIFSDYKQVAWFGVWQRYEGFIVLLCYIFIFFAVFDFCRDKFHTKLILYILTGSAIVIGLVGLSQVLGHDFFKTTFAAKLVSGSAYQEGDLLTPVFTQTYSTLYNPNIMGLYAAFTFPIFLFVGLFYPKKSIFKYILLGTALIMLICLFGSNSAGGMTGIAVAISSAVVLGAIYILKFRENLNKHLFIHLSLFAVLTIGIFMLPSVQTKIQGVYLKFTTSAGTNKNQFTDLEVKDNYANIYMHEDYVHLWYDEEGSTLNISLNDGEKIAPTNVQQVPDSDPPIMAATYDIPGKGTANVVAKNNLVSFTKDGIWFYFGIKPDGTLVPLTSTGEEYDISTPVPYVGFEGRELFASGRGYIWSRSIPLLKENILIGTGPDSFLFSFPQDDILGKTRFMGNPYITVDKAHNLYLQTAINTGLISLLAMLTIFAIYLWDTLKNLYKSREKDNYYFGLKFGLLIGMIAYFVTSVTTDSSISVSPVFWGMLGLGFSLNHFRKEEKN